MNAGATTAHVDTFARDHLPARAAWPDLLDAPGCRTRMRLNAADALLAGGRGGSAVRARRRVRVDATTSCASAPGAVARVLVEEMGLAPGNRVLLHGPNTPELIAAWLGVLRAGGIVVATMPLLRAGELGEGRSPRRR